MFYVVHGYSSPDHCTRDGDTPVLSLTKCKGEAEVMSLHAGFQEEIHDDCSYVTFVVIEGVERQIEPVETVTEYKLK